MASSVIGALRVNLGLDSAQFNRGARQAESRAARLGSQMKKIGAAASLVGAGVALAIRGQLTAADELGKSAQMLGVPVEALSQLQHAAKMSGASLTGLETGLRRLSANMVDFPDKFNDLGIAVRDADGEIRPTTDVMADLADVMEGMPDGAEKTAIAMDLMGRTGAELIPMLNGGEAALRKMMEEADRLGLTITEDTALAAAEFNDNLSRLGGQMQGVVRIITAELAPVLVSISEAVVSVAQKFAGLSDGQRRFAAIAAVVAIAIGPILIGLGFLLTGLTALAGPLGLAIIGLAALGGVAAFVASNWDNLKDRFPKITGAIEAASRKIGPAAKALLDGLTKLAVLSLEQMEDLVGGIGALMRGDWAEALDYGRKIVDRWKDLFGPIGTAIFAEVSTWEARLVTFGKGAVDGLVDGIKSGYGAIKEAVSGLWGAVVEAVSVWVQDMRTLGSDMVKGLIDGITGKNRAQAQGEGIGQSLGEGVALGLSNTKPDFEQDIRDYLNDGEEAARDEAETRSPSKVWMRLGEDLMGGLKDGVEAGSSEAAEAMRGAVQQVNAEGEGLSWSNSVFGKLGASFGDLVADIATGSRKIGDVVADLAKQLLASGINDLVSGLFGGGSWGGGGFFGDLLGSLFGGFRADGGPVSSGRSYVVGERGPELFTPGASGAITSNEAMGGGGAVDVRVHVDQDGNWQAKVEQISGNVARANIAQASPSIVQNSIGTMREMNRTSGRLGMG